MMQVIVAILELFFVLSAARGISFIFLKEEHLSNPLGSLIIRISLGLATISYLTLLAATLHLIGLIFFISVICIGNLLCLKNLNQNPLKPFKFRLSLPAVLLSVFILVNFFYSLFPPTFYDSMLYHLAIPQYYLSNGGIVPWNSNFNSNLPLNGEMLFLFSLLGKTVHIPRLLSFFAGIAILIILFIWFKNYFSERHPLLPLILFYTIPQVGFLASSSKTDMLGFLYLILSHFLFFLYLNKPLQKKLLILSGLFWGFSIGTKYIFGFYFLGFTVALVFFKPLPFRKKFYSIGLICLLIGLCLAPWFVKNISITGNPVYPYLNHIFQSESWSPEQASSFSTGIKRGGGYRFIDYILYPLELFLKPYKYGITAVWGILVLLFFPFLYWARKHPESKFLILSSVVAFVTLLTAAKVPRYFLSSLLLISLPLAFGSVQFFRKNIFFKKILTPIFFMIIGFNFILQVNLQEKFTKGISYLKTKLSWQYKTTSFKYLYILPFYRAVEYLNAHLNHDDLIAVLGEDRTFYMQKRFLASSFADRNILVTTLQSSKNRFEFQNRLRKRGITHILYSQKGLERMAKISSVYRLSDAELTRLSKFFAGYEILYQDERYTVYKI